jgi:ubiquinone biosynthesis monooxygenase Coq7
VETQKCSPGRTPVSEVVRIPPDSFQLEKLPALKKIDTLQQCNGKTKPSRCRAQRQFDQKTASAVEPPVTKCMGARLDRSSSYISLGKESEMLKMSFLDEIICSMDNALRTLGVEQPVLNSCPKGAQTTPTALSDAEKQASGAFMRVNHVGEVCAQALYNGQALATKNPALKKMLNLANQEETEHLAWTAQRLRELGAHRSRLNVLWYAGAFCLGWTAGKLGDATSLGFTVETERQVERHLTKHLLELPQNDLDSLAIVEQMKADEARHAESAEKAGAKPLPPAAQLMMRAAAKVMTTIAHHV